jgi:hypothetical protein
MKAFVISLGPHSGLGMLPGRPQNAELAYNKFSNPIAI